MYINGNVVKINMMGIDYMFKLSNSLGADIAEKYE